MKNENRSTSMGKWSVGFGLISITIISLLLFFVLIPIWFGFNSSEGEGGLAAAAMMGIFISFGIIFVTITSLAGIGLAIGAIKKTLWQQGRTGLLLNTVALLIIAAFLLWIFIRIKY